MKTAIIIAEYNPFHKGHQWQIDVLKKQGYSHIIAIMSGNFVQRGVPAIFPKDVRTKAALLGGVDLVLELPLPYACATAQRFAFGAVSLANACGCGDILCFGSEVGNLSILQEAVKFLLSPDLGENMKDFLSQGMTFAKARTLALAKMGFSSPDVLQMPNNALAIEYLLQLYATRSSLLPVTIPRKDVHHHESSSKNGLASASYIRSLLLSGQIEEAELYVPRSSAELIASTIPVEFHDRVVLSRLRTLSLEQLSALPDCSEGIEHRLYHAIRQACSVDELYALIKTKRYSLSRIRRLVLSAFLEIPADLHQIFPPYLRVLGFTPNGQQLLALMKQTASLPVSSSLARLSAASPLGKRFAKIESSARDLYNLFEGQLIPCGEDYRFSAIRISKHSLDS